MLEADSEGLRRTSKPKLGIGEDPKKGALSFVPVFKGTKDGPDGLTLRVSHPTRNTVMDRGPWAPMTRDCSISAVLEGPEMKAPN